MKNMKLSIRLLISFAIILLLLIGIVTMEVFSLQSIASRKDRMYIATKINDKTANMRNYTLEFFVTESDESAANVQLCYNETLELLEESSNLYKNTENESVIRALREDVVSYYKSFEIYKRYADEKTAYKEEMFNKTDTTLNDLEQIVDSQQDEFGTYIDEMGHMEKITFYDLFLIDKVYSGVLNSSETISLMYNIAISQLRYFLLYEEQYDIQVNEKIETVKSEYTSLYADLEDAGEKEMVITALKSIKDFMTAYEAYKELIANQKNEETIMLDLAGSISATTKDLAKNQEQKMNSSMSSAQSSSMIVGLVGILLGVLFAVTITRSLIKQLTVEMNRLSKASTKVKDASVQLAASGQQLSEGSTEQAAAIEETSATMEETSSMVKRNAENTKQANDLSRQASHAASDGSEIIKNMSNSMDELKKSSTDIANIINVIDEIAFQTNMLALNAAVEAARAGEAGQGFAVVAEEVRRLAQKSAQAANDTSEIIDKNIELSERGVQLSEKVSKALKDIIIKTEDVNRLMEEISVAGEEQAKGTAQVTQSVGEMEKVVQINASTAEESAASAEELRTQSKLLEEIVMELNKLVKGAKKNSKKISRKNMKSGKKDNVKKISRKSMKSGRKDNVKKNGLSLPKRKSKHIVEPEKVIIISTDDDF